MLGDQEHLRNLILTQFFIEFFLFFLFCFLSSSVYGTRFVLLHYFCFSLFFVFGVRCYLTGFAFFFQFENLSVLHFELQMIERLVCHQRYTDFI